MRHPYMRVRMKNEGKADMNSDRIHWNDREKADIAAESFRLTLKDPSLSILAAVSRAQLKVLPTDRHRPLEKTQPEKVAKWLVPMWDGMRADAERATASARARREAEGLFTPHAPDDIALTIAAPPAPPAPHLPDAPGAVIALPPEPAAVLPESLDTPPAEASAANDAAASAEADVEPDNRPHAPTDEERQTARRQVHWKDDERATVAKRAYSNLKRWPDMSRLEAFRKAQDSELVEERRRNLTAWEQVRDWAEPMLEAIELDERIEQARQAEIREKEKQEARERAEAEEAARIEEEQQERIQAEAFERAVQQRVDSLTFDDLINAFARRFGRALFSGFEEGFRGMLQGEQEPPPPAASMAPPGRINGHQPIAEKFVKAPTDRKPKVCVVGLLNQQEHDIERAFLGVAEFVFVKSQQNGGSGAHGGHGMLEKAKHCDAVFSIVGFMGHDVDECAKKLKPLGIPYIRVNGRKTALKRELRDWLDGRIALKAA